MRRPARNDLSLQHGANAATSVLLHTLAARKLPASRRKLLTSGRYCHNVVTYTYGGRYCDNVKILWLACVCVCGEVLLCDLLRGYTSFTDVCLFRVPPSGPLTSPASPGR